MLYLLALYAYTILYFSVICFICIISCFSLSALKFRNRFSLERFGYVKIKLRNSILIHSVSMGECIAVIPLVNHLLIKYPNLSIVISTGTYTGRAYITKFYEKVNNIYCVYLPYDIPYFLKYFFYKINCKICIIMETELWPNFLKSCEKYLIPTILINARLSQKSFNNYSKIKFLIKNMINSITHLAVQNFCDAEYFINLGVKRKNITLTGNIKYDIVLNIQNIIQGRFLKSCFHGKKIWVAASTHEGEEEIILQAHKYLKDKYSNILLILVPRHPYRFDSVYKTIQNFSLKSARRSSFYPPSFSEIDVYLADSLGEMMLLYSISEIVFVGGSFNSMGGHNTVEPSLFGKSIITGKYNSNFLEIMKVLRSNKAVICVDSSCDLANKISFLIQNKKYDLNMGSRAYFSYKKNKGAFTL